MFYCAYNNIILEMLNGFGFFFFCLLDLASHNLRITYATIDEINMNIIVHKHHTLMFICVYMYIMLCILCWYAPTYV